MSRGRDIETSLVLEPSMTDESSKGEVLLISRLQEDGSWALVPAEVISDPSDDQVRVWMDEWRDFGDDDDVGRATADWDWVRKPSLVEEGRFCRRIAIVAEEQAQGLILISAPEPSRLTPTNMTVYAEYIESAPWNRHDVARKYQLFKGIGTFLLYVANCESLELGYGGGFCLHSLPTAEGFYEGRGMTKCRHETCEGGKAMCLFEFDPEAAEAFASSMR